MSLINVSNLTFSYGGGENIFTNASFQIDTDWRLGFVGRNGRGKTTFLNLLMGKYEYSGTISTSVGFEYFPFDVKDKTSETIDVITGVCDFELWQLRRELSLMDADESILYRPFEELSAGERTKALLAALFLKENSFLLIDEPTNHLDLAAREKVCSYLMRKKGFILVSHDRALLDNCTDHVLSINRANIEVQKGNFSSWYRNKQLRDESEIAENERLKKDIKKLTASARRTAAWSDEVEKTKFGTRDSGVKPDKGRIGHKAAKMMKRSKSIEARRENAIDEKSGLLKNIEKQDRLVVRQESYHSERYAEFKDVSIYYDAVKACDGVSFTINRGDRAALRGRNGSGKSSVLKLLTGKQLSFTGELRIGSGLIVSYIQQETFHLAGGLRKFAEENLIDESLFKAILRKLDFTREQLEKDMRDFSEGQKKKVLIAKSLSEKAHLHVWDEPLNFVDVISRIQIEELILENAPTILFVEHDSAFTEKVSNKIIEI